MFFNQCRFFSSSITKFPLSCCDTSTTMVFRVVITFQYLLESFLTCSRVSSSFSNFVFYLSSNFCFSSFCISFLRYFISFFISLSWLLSISLLSFLFKSDNRSTSASFVVFICSLLFFMMFVSWYHILRVDVVSFNFPLFISFFIFISFISFFISFFISIFRLFELLLLL